MRSISWIAGCAISLALLFTSAHGLAQLPVAPAPLAAASRAATAADDPLVIRFYTTSYGYPDPVQAGSTVTWYLQGIDSTDGNAQLENIGWNSSQCGVSTFAGIYNPGDRTPFGSCSVTAPASGTLENDTTFTATVVETGQLLTVDVSSEVTVTPAPTDILVTTSTASAQTAQVGDPITWSFSVSNEGTATLTNVTWTSSRCGTGAIAGQLAPGAVSADQSCTENAAAPGVLVNHVQFAATDSVSGLPVSSDADASVTVQALAAAPPVAAPMPTPRSLPPTGESLGAPLSLAVVLLATGFGALMLGRRR